jgi:cysteine desulfurase
MPDPASIAAAEHRRVTADASDWAVVYLDHAATTPPRPEVAAAIAAASVDGYANPSSQHAAGRRARRLLEDARERILAAVGGRSAGPSRDRLVFPSGATEANWLAVLGLAGGSGAAGGGRAAFSARDHSSAQSAAAALGERGWRVTQLPLNAAGSLDVAALTTWAGENPAPAILSTTLVCGQSGTREDLSFVGRMGSGNPSMLIHADATQAFAATDIAFAESGLATLTLAAHKFGGPRGIGGLVIRATAAVRPMLPGAQEAGLRGGTEAVPLAAGFAAAVELAVAERGAAARRLADLRGRLETGLLADARARGIPAAVVGADAARTPQITTIVFSGIDRQAFVMAADLAGVCCATGAACASGSSEPAPALAAMGLPPESVSGAVRFSVGRSTSDADIDEAIARLRPVLDRLARTAAGPR